MKPLVSKNRLFPGASCMIGMTAVFCILFALPATAQIHKPAKDVPHLSVTLVDIPDAKPSKTAQPVTQQNLADAVVADALRDLWTQSDKHFHEGEYNHIINLHRVVVQGDPKNLEAYEDSAYLLWSMTRSDEALAFLKQGLKANSDNFYLYDEIGLYYGTNLRDYKSAIPYYEQAVKFTCPYKTWHGLALCYEKTNQWEKAVGAWEHAANYADDILAPQRLKRARAMLARQKGNQ